MNITRNKVVELPCFVGDKVFCINYPTAVIKIGVEKPKIIEMTVVKIEYSATESYERMRIDVIYINDFGCEQSDWFMWKDGFLHTNYQDAEKKLNQFLNKNS